MRLEGQRTDRPPSVKRCGSPSRRAISLAGLLTASCGHFDIEHAAADTPQDAPVQSDAVVEPAPDGGAPPGPVVFHHGSAETTTAGSISVQLAKLATRNDVLILTCADTRHGLESGAVSGAGVTWNQAVNTAAESNMEIWYGIVVEPSMADVRIDSTLPKQGDPSFSIRMDLTEWSGLAVDQTSIVDVAIANSGEDKISTDTASPMQITTTYPIDVLVLGVSASSPATFDEPTQGPWSTIGIVDASPNALDSSWYRIVPMRTIANPMVALTTSSGGTMWAAAIAAFKVAP